MYIKFKMKYRDDTSVFHSHPNDHVKIQTVLPWKKMTTPFVLCRQMWPWQCVCCSVSVGTKQRRHCENSSEILLYKNLHNFIEKMHIYTLGCPAKNILGSTSLYQANILSNCFSILFFCIAIFSLTYVLSIKETHSNMATNNINSWNHTVNILLNNINKYSVT